MTLEAHYPLTEDVGNVALDYSGNGFNGTLNGGAGPSGTGTVTGPFGNSAYDFDGSNDWVDINEQLLPTTNIASEPYTIALWAKVTDTGTVQTFVNQRDTSSPFEGLQTSLRSDTTDNEIVFNIRDNNSNDTKVVTNNYPSYGQWAHLAFTFTGSPDPSAMEIYIDGVVQPKDTTQNEGTGSASPSSDTTICADDSASPQRFTDGAIADVRIYSRALSPQEVQALYQAGERSEAVFGVTDSTATARSVSGGGAGGGFYGGGGGGGGSSGGGGGGTTY